MTARRLLCVAELALLGGYLVGLAVVVQWAGRRK